MDTGSASERPIGWGTPPALGRPLRGRIGCAADRLRAHLARPHTSWEIAGLALVALLPTLWSGLAFDDLLHRLIVEGKIQSGLGRLDLFAFVSPDPATRAHFKELGVYPWWISPHMQVSYWRPLAALTHFVDYALWPRAAWLMHLENLAWYGALVLACGALYRRFLRGAASGNWIAGFAVACYAFDQAHAFPVAWVANRNAVMAAMFGVVALLAHDRWRSERRPVFAALAAGSLALALLSAESGVAIAGYVAAHVLVFERGVRRRAVAIAPTLVVIGAWRAVYRVLGYGALGSGANLDPLIDPAAFVLHAARTLPILLGSEITLAPPELLLQHPEWTAVAILAAVAVLTVFGAAVWPLVRRDETSAFFAAGALLSALPLGGTFPSDRYLFWVGLGVIGLVAQLAGAVFGARAGSVHPARYAVCCALLLLRGVVSPALFPFRAAGPGLLEDDYEQMVDTIPRGADFTRQTVVLLNAPLDLFAGCLPIVALARGHALPAHMYTLYAGAGDVTVSRQGDDALEVRSQRGWFARPSDRLFRREPLAAGASVDLEAMNARVGALTGDGRPESVVFRFPLRLDDPSLLFLTWGNRGFERVAPPAEGAELTVPAAPLFVKDVLRPHLRQRATEDDEVASTR